MINDRGFTLIEVLITMAIFSIGILAVALLQVNSINRNTTARMHTEATVVAVDWLERLRSLPYNHPDLIEDQPHQAQAGTYIVQWQVSEDNNLPLKTITVSVDSDNPYARSVSVSSRKPQAP